ncbi:hypothetical protein PQE75_gp185 [Bacillus phage vB_BcoS-136]|uniref:Uncharacterized protein n=1 Tax=Bacillus phage vB_BcoS-136 TaxID=2419619 RepID=A0A3G3BVN7_9CAUD|nr:hypothetical protein PQE75_gp185 [Bacillus phage vB_BcoS-136]AYP68294.1 hypothetical protein vBBcoS136_00180 [Bacillus phage vB_BcoS-136]
MKKDVLDIFYENWDGDIVLSNIHNFKSEQDFLEQAQKYVDKTRGYHIPVITTNTELITIVVNEDGEWHSKNIADKKGFDGEEMLVYKADLDWESVNY